MKIFKHFLLMSAVAGSLMLGSCTKDPVTSNTTSGNTGRIVCKLNGASWSSDAQDKYYYLKSDTLVGTSAVLSNGELIVQGTRVLTGDTSTIVIQLVLTPAKTGKYEGTFSTSAADGALYIPNRNFIDLLQIAMTYTNTYSVTLTKVDETNKKVSGVFSINMKAPAGAGKPDYIVTEGSFTDLTLR